MTEPAAQPGDFIAPSVEELQALFPQLEVLDLIACGGMGAVFRARQPQLDRLVALKILPPSVGQDPEYANRFRREARAMAQLNHPYVVGIYDFGQAGDFFYFVMEHVDGYTLHDLIQGGGLDEKKTLNMFAQICEGLNYAHGKGVVHLDIKPGNIMLDKEGHAKILDFGLASLRKGGEDDSAEEDMGTPDYAAPERFGGEAPVDHRADIYSMGVMLYEMLTGGVPSPGFSPASEVAESHPAIDDLITKCLQAEPDDRYATAKEVSVALVASRRAATTTASKKKVALRFSAAGDGRPVRDLAAEKRKESANQRRAQLIRLLIFLGLLGGGWFLVKDKFDVKVGLNLAGDKGEVASNDPTPETIGANAPESSLSEEEPSEASEPTSSRIDSETFGEITKLRQHLADGQMLQQADFSQIHLGENGSAYLFLPLALDYASASRRAERFGAKLASISSSEEDAIVRKVAAAAGHSGFYLGATNVNGSWQWDDGSPWDYSKFAVADNPKEFPKPSVVHYGDYWKVMGSKKQRSAVFEWSPNSSPSLTSSGTPSAIPEELVAIAKGHEDRVASFDSARTEATEGLIDKYLEALNRLEQKRQVAGNSDGVLQIRQEAVRMKAKKALPEPLSSNPDLSRLQSVFGEHLDLLSSKHTDAVTTSFEDAKEAASAIRSGLDSSGRSAVDAFLANAPASTESPSMGSTSQIGGSTPASPISRGVDENSLNVPSMTLEKVATLSGHKGQICGLDISPSSPFLVTGASDATIKIWQSETGVLLQTLTAPGPIGPVSFSKDGNFIAAGCTNSSQIAVWSMDSRKIVREFGLGNGNEIRDLAFMPDGRSVVAIHGIDEGEEICVWDLSTVKVTAKITLEGRKMRHVAVAGDGERLLISGDGRGSMLFSIPEGKAIWDNIVGPDGACAFSRDDSRAHISHATVAVETGDLLHEEVAVKDRSDVEGCSSGEDGVFAIGLLSGNIALRSATNGGLISTQRAHPSGCHVVAFYPDGNRFASGGRDASAIIWEIVPTP